MDVHGEVYSIRVLNTTLCYKVCQWLATGRWFSPGTPVSSTNKTDPSRYTVNQLISRLLCFAFFCFKTVSRRFNFAITKMLKVQIFHGMTLVYIAADISCFLITRVVFRNIFFFFFFLLIVYIIEHDRPRCHNVVVDLVCFSNDYRIIPVD